MKTNTTKKVISILLSIFMLITMAPLSAFAVEEYNEIKPGDTYTVTKEEYVKFVPDESGTFIIRSVSDVDPRVRLYDSNMEQLGLRDDDNYRENANDFYFEYEYTAGETYYFHFYDVHGEYNYTVILFAPCIEHTGGTQTCKGYKCDVCKEWYGEGTGEHIDEDENGLCDVCNEFSGNEIKVGETYTVTKEEYVKFVPIENGKFIIRSVSNVDPKVTLYDSDISYITMKDDSYYRENGYDFYFVYEFTAGETYYFQFYDHAGRYNYTVILFAPCIEHTGGTRTCKGYKCEVCLEWYGEGTGVHIDEDGNGFCDDCDAFVGNEIKVGETYTVTKEECVKFVPDENGTFIIRSVSDTDPRVQLHDSNLSFIDSEDDSKYREENNLDFYFKYEYTAGETYYFYLTDCNGEYNYTVILFAPCIEHTGGTQTCKGYQCDVCKEWYGEGTGEHDLDTEQTCKGYICNVCGEWFGEPDETKHSWFLGECEHCGIEYPADLECEHIYTHERGSQCITCGAWCPHETIENGTCTDCHYNLPFSLTTGENITYHDSFSDALDKAEDGSVIKLLRDYSGSYSVEINKAITLDLNGKEWIQPSSGQFDINAPAHFTDSVGGGYLDYGLNLYSPVTFSGGSYRYIRIRFETEDTLSDYLADGYDYFDYDTDEVLDLSSEKHTPNAVIKFNDRFTGIKDDHFYKNDIMQKAYQLVEFEGDFYFIDNYNKIAKNKRIYLSERFVEGTDLKVGYYDFDENGKMLLKNGPVGDYFYSNGIRLNAYQLVEYEGNYYFINDAHKLAKNKRIYLSQRFVEGTDLSVGYYDFDADGKLVMLNGPVGDYFYKDGVRQNAYQLVEFEGDYYFINNSNKLAKNTRIYLSQRFVEGTDLAVGYYEFDADGKLVLLNGPVGDYFYKDGVRQNAYQLVEFEGDYYFINDSHKLAKNKRIYLSQRFVEGTDLKVGYYNFDADGKMIIE